MSVSVCVWGGGCTSKQRWQKGKLSDDYEGKACNAPPTPCTHVHRSMGSAPAPPAFKHTCVRARTHTLLHSPKPHQNHAVLLTGQTCCLKTHFSFSSRTCFARPQPLEHGEMCYYRTVECVHLTCMQYDRGYAVQKGISQKESQSFPHGPALLTHPPAS